MFHHFTQLVANASGWAYAILFVLALLDAVIPIVPSETSVITAGVVASQGDLSLALVIVFSAAGAFAGDNTAYWLGNRYGRRINDRFFSSDKSKQRVEWAHRQVEERGGELILIARFIPGGRTVVTLSAGTLEYPYRKFVLFDAIAASTWASYAALLGYFGGQAFESQPWKGLLLALAIAFAVTGTVELVRWFLKRRRGQSSTTA
ncbi:MAG TPA: DedA family protein [Gaiellaceae bacterium]|nr:DedA family protein [Gaiellaceae bacterium]